jgi:pimeloyl-ACP methyl ester carboxylesterase
MPDDLLTVDIADGRRLEAIVSGPADGLPVVLHHGTPVGLVPWPSFLDPAQCGWRTVQYARPGYGGSSPQPGRSVGDAATDTAAVLDAIGADRFVTVGLSGGGPHALACAAQLPDRCLATTVVAGLAPFGLAPEVYEEQAAQYFGMIRAGDETELLKACDENMTMSGARAEDLADKYSLVLCAADRECITGEFAEFLAAGRRAGFASGIEGNREDDVAFANDWGFKVADARGVAIWHGAEDLMVRVVHGVWLKDHIPGVELHVLPNEGHASIQLRLREIFHDLISRSQAADRVSA